MTERTDAAIRLLTTRKGGLTAVELWDRVGWAARPSSTFLARTAATYGYEYVKEFGADGILRHRFTAKGGKVRTAKKTTPRRKPS